MVIVCRVCVVCVLGSAVSRLLEHVKRNQSSGFWEEYGRKPESGVVGLVCPVSTVVVLTINHADWRLGVVCFTTREDSPGPDIARIHRLIALSLFYGWRCMVVLSWSNDLSG